MRHLSLIAIAATLMFAVSSANAADEREAKRFAKDQECFKCHSVTREKDGPSYTEIGKKYASKPNSAEALYKHITSNPIVKVEGKEEEHKAIKGDRADIDNLIAWILSLK